ncbi:MAG: DUF2812 domain-containing protein [Clostridia bacterium]
MKQRIRKLFWAWEFEKEEQWLNQAAAEGRALTDVGFCRYDFEPCPSGAYEYRLEFLEHFPTHKESADYIRFMEETGAEYVGSVQRWVYFRKAVQNGPFEIYSDANSKINHFKRIRALLLCLVVLEFSVSLLNLGIGVVNSSAFNIGVALPNFLLGLLILYGALFFTRIINRLKKEQFLHE